MLGPFQRVKAVLWQRSLALYERWHLGSTDWYPKLKREHRRSFAGIDPHAVERLESPDDIFGETPMLTVYHMLRWIDAAVSPLPEPFVDLGSGRGLPSLTAASLGYSAVGYEREASWVERAQTVADRLALKARFEAVDLTTARWPESGTFYATTTSWTPEQKSALFERLAEEGGPRVAILLDAPPLDRGFRHLWSRTVPVDWGRAQAELWYRESRGPNPSS